MPRYIDADKILYTDLSEGRGVCWVTFMDWIKEMPTADVRENVSGEWQDYEDHEFIYHICSICGYESVDQTKYCPNCGALMIGDNNV